MFERLVMIALLCGCSEPPTSAGSAGPPRDTPREIPHVPEAVAPVIEAAEARTQVAAQIAEPSGEPSEADREAADRAALERLTANTPTPEGRVHLLAPTRVQGRFNPESLRGAMEPALEQLEACYTNALREDRHAVGRLVATWTISGNAVTDVQIEPSTLGSEVVVECLRDWLTGLRVRGSRVVITQPFLFHHDL